MRMLRRRRCRCRRRSRSSRSATRAQLLENLRNDATDDGAAAAVEPAGVFSFEALDGGKLVNAADEERPGRVGGAQFPEIHVLLLPLYAPSFPLGHRGRGVGFRYPSRPPRGGCQPFAPSR